MKSSEKEILRFIDRLYKDLYLSDEVLHHSYHNKTDKFNNLKEYFDMLERMHDRVLKSNSRKDILKKLYQDRYVIREEDIPNSYYQLFLKMDLDRGFGHVSMDEINKEPLGEMVIDDQVASLNTWLDYLLSEEAQKYPFWAKYWAFQGMLRLGRYNKKEGKYNKRTNDTTTAFVEFNKEALELSIDAITKYLNKEEIDDKELAKLIESGSFSKSYLYFLNQSKNLNSEKKNQGIWIRYKMGSDHRILSNSLKGYNTGWCTVNNASAENQLKYGDFYVYYTLDGNNEYKIPRIAIRMDNNNSSIAEIRGIESEQKLEPEMVEIAKEKAKDLFDKENYFELEKNTNKLTEIYYKQKNKEKLTKEDIAFLYDTDLFKVGFANCKDPRIDELKKRRNQRKDLALIYGCTL